MINSKITGGVINLECIQSLVAGYSADGEVFYFRIKINSSDGYQLNASKKNGFVLYKVADDNYQNLWQILPE